MENIIHNKTLTQIKNEFVGKHVIVKAKGDFEFTGVLYTLDPVSKSVVLLSNGGSKIDFVFGHCVTSVDLLDGGESVEEIRIPASLEGPSCSSSTSSLIDLSDDEKHSARNKLKKWLTKNLLTVEELGDELRLAGNAVTILPPYTVDSCLSTNEIVLDRVRRLICSMPAEL